jgi:UDP-glucuronate 4-epimerase
MKILITGGCGFIGSNLSLYLLKNTTHLIYVIDNMIDNYDISFKKNNLEELINYVNFTYYNENILGTTKIREINPDIIIHLSSIPGVRKSMEDPLFYIKNNIDAFVYLLEECRKYNIKRVIYASSSSVYGRNKKTPFSEIDNINELNSSYACSKKCMEVYGKYYNDVFNINVVGLRFFTVYGERGRPDMAPYIFLKNISENKEILSYGNGNSSRDYTYVTDIISGIMAIVEGKGKNGEIYNLGNSNPISLNDFISLCEAVVNKKAIVKIVETQLGDVPHTYADISKAINDLGYNPIISLKEGLTLAYNWMIKNHRINN